MSLCLPSKARLCAWVCVFAFVAGCSGSGSGLATVKMRIGQRNFTLEVADTPSASEHGLMERDSMPADHGMIFVFESEEPRFFWMKNTRFPLDILFLDRAGRIVSIRSMKAYDLGTTASDYPAKYAIELNFNAAKEAGVNEGQQVVIPEEARQPKSDKK